jgi:protein-tyrosine sulfotransferase
MQEPNIKHTPEEIQKASMVFLLGMGRSGTTLLQESMQAHPNIVAPYECDFVLYLYPKFGHIKKWSENDIHQFVEALFFLPNISQVWQLNKEKVTVELLSILPYANYQMVCKKIFFQMAGNKEKVLIISDKFPPYIAFVKKLLAIFPDAKFIHLVRDPRDVMNSMSKRLGRTNVYFNCWKWLIDNRLVEKIKQKVPAIFFSTTYENMVQNPEETYRALCSFLQIPFHDSMLHHQFKETLKKYENEKFYEKIKNVHTNLVNPINTSNVHKWEKEMSKTDIAITERITGKYAKEKYGYDISISGGNTANVSTVKLIKNKLLYCTWLFYIRYRSGNFALNTRHKKKRYFGSKSSDSIDN